MGIITLQGMVFFANHGNSEEEQKVGNRYEVNVKIEMEIEKAAKSDKIGDTLNYEAVYNIVKKAMNVRKKLLESLVINIIDECYENFPEIFSCEVEVIKHNPPVGGLCQMAKVSEKR